VIEDAIEDHCRRLAPERHATGDHLIEHGAKREQVAARIELLPARLFRRHEGDRAHRSPRTREVLRRDGQRFARSGGLEPPRLIDGGLGQSEVENLRFAAAGDEDVSRLDVAMDNAGTVCRIQTIGDPDRDVHDLGDRQPVMQKIGVERLALE
jgi:hypothetical protein